MASIDPRKQFGNQVEQQVINPQTTPLASPELAGFAARSVMEGYNDMSRALTGIAQNIENAVKTEEKTRLRAYEQQIRLADAETTSQIRKEEMDSGVPYNAEQLKQRKNELLSTRVADGYANGNFYYFKDEAAELKDLGFKASLQEYEQKVIYPRVVDNVIANTVKAATDAQTEAYNRLQNGDIPGAMDAINRSRQEYQQGPFVVAAGRAQAQAKALDHDKQILDGLRAQLSPEQFLELTRPALAGEAPGEQQTAGPLAGLADADIQAKLRNSAMKELEHNVKAKQVEEAARVKLVSDMYASDYSIKLSKAEIVIANGGTPNWKELRRDLEAISPYLDVGDRARAEASLDNQQAQYIKAKRAQASVTLDSGIFDGKEQKAMEATIQSGQTLEQKISIQLTHMDRSPKPYVSPRLVGELKQLALQGNQQAIDVLQRFQKSEEGLSAVKKIPGLNQFLETYQSSSGSIELSIQAYKTAQTTTPVDEARRKDEWQMFANADRKTLQNQILDKLGPWTKELTDKGEQTKLVSNVLFRAQELHKTGTMSPEAYIDQAIAIEQAKIVKNTDSSGGVNITYGPQLGVGEDAPYQEPFVRHSLAQHGKPVDPTTDVRVVHAGSVGNEQVFRIEVRPKGTKYFTPVAGMPLLDRAELKQYVQDVVIPERNKKDAQKQAERQRNLTIQTEMQNLMDPTFDGRPDPNRM